LGGAAESPGAGDRGAGHGPPGSDAGAKIIRVRAFVDGRVQGVGFRYSTAREATRLGIQGWARNLPDGRVEAVYEGPRDAVEEMLGWTRRGPAGARVDEMAIHAEKPRGEQGFKVG
jgi:acylphosphatase